MANFYLFAVMEEAMGHPAKPRSFPTPLPFTIMLILKFARIPKSMPWASASGQGWPPICARNAGLMLVAPYDSVARVASRYCPLLSGKNIGKTFFDHRFISVLIIPKRKQFLTACLIPGKAQALICQIALVKD